MFLIDFDYAVTSTHQIDSATIPAVKYVAKEELQKIGVADRVSLHICKKCKSKLLSEERLQTNAPRDEAEMMSYLVRCHVDAYSWYSSHYNCSQSSKQGANPLLCTKC